jgi:SAM-dependent methyltransferase
VKCKLRLNKEKTEEITPEQFAASFGVKFEDIDQSTRDLICETDLRYREVEGEELEDLILQILKRIETDSQIVGAPERKQKWQDGWQENLEELCSSGKEESSLVPKFIRPGVPVRWRQRYLIPQDPAFELNYVKILRNWFASRFFLHSENVYEFGCGTGFNLLEISKLFPEKQFFGSDFVDSSVAIVNRLASTHKSIKGGEVFDMLHPDENYQILPNSAVFTFGAIEQLAGDIDPVFEYFWKSEAAIVLHIEPDADFYDRDNLVDFLAYKFQTKRGYSRGISHKLKEWEAEGRVRVVDARRLYFGSLFMEGYNLFVWKPLR